MPGGCDDDFACPGRVGANGGAAWRDRGPRHRVRGGRRGQRPAGQPGGGDPRHRRRQPFRPHRRPPGRRDHRAWQRQARQRVQDRVGSDPPTLCASGRPPGGVLGGCRLPLAGGGTDVPVLPLVRLCLGLLWLRPRPVAAGAVVAAFTPGLAVLFTLAVGARLGWFAHPAGLLAWLRSTRLPRLAAAAGTRASQGRCGLLPGSLPWRRNGWRELTGRMHGRLARADLRALMSRAWRNPAVGPGPWGKQGAQPQLCVITLDKRFNGRYRRYGNTFDRGCECTCRRANSSPACSARPDQRACRARR